jgi:hypothetical protein
LAASGTTGDTSLAALHETIQVVFGCDDDRMHVFHTPYGEFGVADARLGYRAEAPVTLAQVAPSAGGKIGYTYDFGDDRNLEIVVEKLHTTNSATDPTGTHAAPVAAAPRRLEDSGIDADIQFIAAFADREHPDHENAIDGLGYTNRHPDFDPVHFDIQTINDELSRLR